MTNWVSVTVTLSLGEADELSSTWKFPELEPFKAESDKRVDLLLKTYTTKVLHRTDETGGRVQIAKNVLKDLGRDLFAALVPSEFRDEAGTAVADILGSGSGARLLLNLQHDDLDGNDSRLERLPWELARAGEWLQDAHVSAAEGVGYLALVPGISVVRTGRAEADSCSSGDTGRPLHVVLVDAGRAGGRTMSGTSVQAMNLPAGLQPRELTGRHATAEDLRQELERKHFNAVHFTGHGMEADEDGQPRIQFDGQKWVGLRQLGSDFGEADVKLAMIAACYTGTAGGWSGAGSVLMSRVPAVVSFQAATFDDQADVLSGALYTELARGSNIDDAVAAARRSVATKEGLGDWWLPVLHTRSEPFAFAPIVAARPRGEASVRRPADEGRFRTTPKDMRLRPWNPLPGQRTPPLLSSDGAVCVLSRGEGKFTIGTLSSDGSVLWWPASTFMRGGHVVAVHAHPFSAQVLIHDNKTGVVRTLNVAQSGKTAEADTPVEGDATSGAWTGAGFTWASGSGAVGTTDAQFRQHLPPQASELDAALGDGQLMVAWLDGAELKVSLGKIGSDLRRTGRAIVDGEPTSVEVARPISGPPGLALVRQGDHALGWTMDDLLEST